MGFDIAGSRVALEFAPGTILAGAHVEASLELPIRDFLVLQRTFARFSDAAERDELMGEQGDGPLEQAFHQFGDKVLLGWDITYRGQDIQPTGDGMLSLPMAVASAIFAAWAQAVAGPGPNSDAASANGKSLEAASALTAAG